MQTPYKKLLLSAFELWCIVAASVAIFAAGNAKLFLEHFGLISSSSEVGSQVSSRVGSGLVTLDSYSITPGLVTFITWGVVGLVTFSIAQAFMRASGAIKFQREVSSNQYVHPQNFNRDRYWRRIVTDAIISFAVLTLFATGFSMYLFYVLPVSFTDIQRFLLNATTANLSGLLLGTFAILAGTAVVYFLGKIVVWRHRLQR